MYKKSLPKDAETILDKKKFTASYGMRFTKAQLDKLDDKGVIKPGSKLEYGDPLVLAMRKTEPSAEQKVLGQFSKSLLKPFEDISLLWDKAVPAEIVDAMDSTMQVMVTVKTAEPMKIGDKLSGRFGNKSVVSEIIDDEKMIRDENDEPIDVLVTSAGVVSRVNPNQIVEAALGKVAYKTGKPVVMPQFDRKNLVKYAKNELEKAGVKDKETVFDPVSGKQIPDIFVGRSFMHKLFKNTESNFSARGVSSYDINEQPTRGGQKGAASLGKMEINGLLAHGARAVVKEAMTTKSQQNDEFWRAYELGLPLPPAKRPFASQKFEAMMKGAGINVKTRDAVATLAPLTDKDVEALSSGAVKLPELDKSRSMLINASTMQPEKGGLFDPLLTGGMSGEKWSHIDLPEPILNPVFEDPVRRMLGMTKKDLAASVHKEGGQVLRDKLNNLDLVAKEKELVEKTKRLNGTALNNAVKELKYIRALKANKLKAGDAYTMQKIAVVPPVMRPIVASNSGSSVQISDANYLYRDVGLAASALQSVKGIGVESMNAEARKTLHETVGALYGTSKSTTPQLSGRDATGMLEQLTGTKGPKHGFIQSKMLSKKQDLSGRGTIAPDVTLPMDEVGLPEDMAWTMYEKMVIKGLVAQGYRPTDAAKKVEERAPVAVAILKKEMSQRPVFINRAPTLHRFGILAAYPQLRKGKTIHFPDMMTNSLGADYDGDAVQIHLPISNEAVAEAKNLTLSKILFSDKNREDLLALPQHEAAMGAYLATAGNDGKAPASIDTMDGAAGTSVSVASKSCEYVIFETIQE